MLSIVRMISIAMTMGTIMITMMMMIEGTLCFIFCAVFYFIRCARLPGCPAALNAIFSFVLRGGSNGELAVT